LAFPRQANLIHVSTAARILARPTAPQGSQRRVQIADVRLSLEE